MSWRAHIHIRSSPRRRSQDAASLLVWIAAIAMIAILLAFTLPTLIRETDQRVAREETAVLKTFGDALLAAITRLGYIPSHTNWAESVAAEAGFNTIVVATNARHQPRLLLIDTNGWFNQVSLPYTQTRFGSGIDPQKTARMMIISSVGSALPLSAGPLSAVEFTSVWTNLWNAFEGSLPATPLWAGWDGRPEDVKVERVDISARFISLRLATHKNEPTLGYYSIGADNTLVDAPRDDNGQTLPVVFPSYYLQGTVLNLYNANDPDALDSRQILNRDGRFRFWNGIWINDKEVGGGMPGGDISAVVAAFLNAVPNTNARYTNQQQRLVVEAMMDYMSNYNVWAGGGFSNASLKSYLLNTVQPDMITTFQELFQGSYYPTNTSGPQ
jgi:type II secretory pathway pseudopilin PulG